MMPFVSSFMILLQEFSDCFTRPSFDSLLILLQGWILCPRRTITGMILSAGAAGAKHHSAFHRVFATARWSLDQLGLILLLKLIVPWCSSDRILLAGDDTLCRKKGLKIFGVGMHHDPLISTRKKALMNWGHSWVILAVLVELPWRRNFYFALPILFRLYRSKQTLKRRPGGRYYTRPELMVQMLELLCAHCSWRRFCLIADSAYSGQSVLKHLPANCDLTGRLHLDARLYDAPPARIGKINGRPRKRGQRLATPRQMLQGRCEHLELEIYGRHDKVRLSDTVARAYCAPKRPLRVVAVEPLTGGRDLQAFFSTCWDLEALEVLGWYARRWAIECAIHDAKGQLGFEDPQNWTKKAVCRTAPMALLLYTLIVIWFTQTGHEFYAPLHRPWYLSKRYPSFADMLATLKIQSLKEAFNIPNSDAGVSKPLQFLIHSLRIAA